MLYTLFNVVYVLVAVAMTALILLQQGDGAAAGSGFGAGASGTVFGARGSANFLSKSTAVLAAIFFLMSLGMAVYMHKAAGPSTAADDTGIMGSAVPAETVERHIPASSEVPQPTRPRPRYPRPPQRRPWRHQLRRRHRCRSRMAADVGSVLL